MRGPFTHGAVEAGDDGLRRQLAEADGATLEALPMAERYAEIFEAAIVAGPLPSLLAMLAPAAAAVLLYLGIRSQGTVARPGWRAGRRRGADGKPGAAAAEAPRRRILLVINLLFWAGAETQLRNLAIGLRKLGHDVTLVAVEDITSHAEDLERAGVRMESLGARDRIGKLRALPALVRAARRAEVVHCTGWDASLWGRLAAILARRPVVVAEHAGDRSLQVSRSGAPRARLIALHNRILDPATNATVVVSSAQAPQLEAEGVRADSIVLIPNGVPVAEFKRRAVEAGCARSALGIPPEAKTIMHVARFATPKNQAATLDVVARLRQQLGDVRAVFVGDGETEEAVRRRADELGAGWATFLGSRDDVPALLRAADLAVLPSTAEGLPMSLLESIAVGTPVVATDVGDVRLLLEATRGGICVPKEDDDAFAAACARVLTDPDLSARLREEGQDRVEDFDAAHMAERYSHLLEAAIESRPPSSLRDELVLES